MQVASVSSNGPTIRSEIDGWTFEDASLLVKQSHGSSPGKIFIGYTPSPKDIPYYTSILEMLADGWELLGPPKRETWEADGKQHEQWSWWLQRKSSAWPSTSSSSSNKVVETAQRVTKLYRSGVMGDLADLPEGIRDLIRALDELARP